MVDEAELATVVVVTAPSVVEELEVDDTEVEEVEVSGRDVVARKELEVECADDELEPEDISDAEEDTAGVVLVEKVDIPLRGVDDAAEDELEPSLVVIEVPLKVVDDDAEDELEPSLVVTRIVEPELGRMKDELDTSLRRDVEEPDVDIASTADKEELAGASTEAVGKLEVTTAVDMVDKKVAVDELDVLVVEGDAVLADCKVVTVAIGAEVSVCRVEADTDPAGTDSFGVIVRDADVMEVAADEVVDMIAVVEVAIVVVALGVASSSSADVFLALHDDPSPKNPALHTHITLSVSLPSAHVEVGDALAPHVLQAVHATPLP
jgi:hypothetical protein